MANYRSVHTSFWTDTKVVDDFTPEDRYFYLYLFTNPHTNLSGCYEISIGQMANELGYSRESVERLIDRMERVHEVIAYSKETKEILIVNWSKYNWTSSEKFRAPLSREIDGIKNEVFRSFLIDVFEGKDVSWKDYGYGTDTVSIPYPYGSDTPVTITDTVSNTSTDTVSDSVNTTSTSKNKKSKGRKKQSRISIDEFDKAVDSSSISEALKAGAKEWGRYKEERGEPYVPTGVKMFLRGLEKAEAEHGTAVVINALETAMAHNWVGPGLERITSTETARSGTTNSLGEGETQAERMANMSEEEYALYGQAFNFDFK